METQPDASRATGAIGTIDIVRRRGKTALWMLLAGLTALAFGCGGASENDTGNASRISMDNQGFQADGPSRSPSISADGTLIAFASDAGDIHLGDTNGVTDLFLRNVTSGTTDLITWNASGALADGPSASPALSADGKFVAFASDATDLVTGDTNNATDIFLYTVATASAAATTRRISPDNTNNGPANGASSAPSISADGTMIAFVSRATDLTTDTDTNGVTDIFVRDTTGNTTQRISVRGVGTQANGASAEPALSGDGKFVAFTSDATDLELTLDNNNATDVFIRDLTQNTTARVSLRDNDLQANGASVSPALSRDGKLVVFASAATDLLPILDTSNAVDIFIRDVAAGTTRRISVNTFGLEANGPSANPVISADGRYVLFTSAATDLVPNDTNGITDLFLRDRTLSTTTRVSNGIEAQANGVSGSPAISANGTFGIFVSSATNLVVGDTNGVDDVFLTAIPVPVSP